MSNSNKETKILDHTGKTIPKATTLAEWLQSIGLKAKAVIVAVIALIGVAGAVIGNLGKIADFFGFEKSQNISSTKQASTNTPKDPIQRSGKGHLSSSLDFDSLPPEITFRDGVRAAVEFSLVTSIEENDAAIVVAMYGGRENAMKVLAPQAEAELISLMEQLTIAEARSRRNAISLELLSRLQEKFKENGIKRVNADAYFVRAAHYIFAGYAKRYKSL